MRSLFILALVLGLTPPAAAREIRSETLKEALQRVNRHQEIWDTIAIPRLIENGVWKKGRKRLVRIAPYDLPLSLGPKPSLEAFQRYLDTGMLEEDGADFHISPFIFHYGTKAEDPYIVLSRDAVDPKVPPLARFQSECPHGHLIGSLHCDCASQLLIAKRMLVGSAGGGHIVLGIGERHAGRGIGRIPVMGMYANGDETGLEVVRASFNDIGFEHDERSWTNASYILQQLGAERVRLLTNNPDKVKEAKRLGLEIADVIQLTGALNEWNLKERILLMRLGHNYDPEELRKAEELYVQRYGRLPEEDWSAGIAHASDRR